MVVDSPYPGAIKMVEHACDLQGDKIAFVRKDKEIQRKEADVYGPGYGIS